MSDHHCTNRWCFGSINNHLFVVGDTDWSFQAQHTSTTLSYLTFQIQLCIYLLASTTNGRFWVGDVLYVCILLRTLCRKYFEGDVADVLVEVRQLFPRLDVLKSPLLGGEWARSPTQRVWRCKPTLVGFMNRVLGLESWSGRLLPRNFFMITGHASWRGSFNLGVA